MSSIWHRKPDIDIINNQMNKGTIGEHLEILMTEVGDDYITGTMPADARTFQPYASVMSLSEHKFACHSVIGYHRMYSTLQETFIVLKCILYV